MNKEHLVTDKYGNTPLSLAIEAGDMEKVRQMYSAHTGGDADLLKRIAVDSMNPSIQEHLSWDARSRIYSEAKYRLDLLGEDTTDVIDAYRPS